MNGLLTDQVAVLTGAGGGIGRAIATEFVAQGADMVLVDRDQAALDETIAEIGTTERKLIPVVADVTSVDDTKRYIKTAVDEFGRIDAMLNNAGLEGKVAPTHEHPEEWFDQVIAVNLRGVFLGMKYALQQMIEQGSGAVLNTSSTSGLLGFCGHPAYTAAKHGVVGLTRTAAGEVGRYNVRVNAIGPGMTNTRLMREVERDTYPEDPERSRALYASTSPMMRYTEPEEVASLAAFLVSPKASGINGAYYLIDGGMSATREAFYRDGII
jgi:NAD(P)-dependent dehydrogenase (short-subunit alcohol dehydrogenase family)